MTREPLPPQPSSRRNKTLGRVVIALSLTATATTLGAFWYARYFLNERLSPFLEAEFSKSLKRPVKLGKVERVDFSGVRFGKSEIPATSKEENFLVADALDVKVDVLRYIQTRKLRLDVVVLSPLAYLKQDLTTGLYVPKIEPEATQENFVDLRTVTVENGNLTLQPAKTRNPVTLTQLKIQSNWQILDPRRQSLDLNGTGQVVLPIIANSNVVPTPEQLLKAIKEQKNDGGTLNITTNWDLTHGQGKFELRSQNLIANALQGFLTGLPLTPLAGRVDGTVILQTQAGKPNPDLQGNVKVRDATLLTANIPEPFKHVSGNVVFDGNNANLQGISGNYGPLSLRADGTINAQSGFNVDVALEPTDIATTLTKFGIKTAVPLAGELKVTAKIKGKQPQITAQFGSTKPITVDRIILNKVQGQVSSQNLSVLEFTKIDATPALGGRIQGQGQLRLPQGKNAGSVLFAFNGSGINAEKVATAYETKLPIPVGVISAAVQVYGPLSNVRVLADLNAPNAQYPARGEIELAGNVANVRNATVQFPIGAVNVAGTFNLTGNKAWQAQLTSTGIPLAALAQNSPNPPKGTVSGVVNLNSPSGSFELSKLTAKGDLNFPQGIAALPDAIAARLAWDGANLLVSNLQVSNYLTASGKVNLEFDDKNTPKGIAGIDLDLRSRNVSISRLRSFVPQLAKLNSGTVNFNGRLVGALDALNVYGGLRVEDVKVSQFAASFLSQLPAAITSTTNGYLTFDGKVEGPVSAIKLDGNLQLFDLQFNRLAFEPRLAGPLSFDGQRGLTVDLEGGRDRIAASLDSRFQPINVAIKLKDATANANRIGEAGDRLNVAVNNFPVPIIASLVGQPNLDGKISSQLVVNLGSNPSASGNVVVDQPRFGRIQAEQLTARLDYANGNTNITNGTILIRPPDDKERSPSDRTNTLGEYKFNLAYNPTADTQLQGQVSTTQGRVRDVFALLQWEKLKDIDAGLNPPVYGSAADLRSIKAIGLGISPLYQQLEYFSQITTRIDRQETIAAANNSNLPPLSEFAGSFSGSIGFSSSKSSGLGLSFDLTGKNWDYGKFAIDDVVAKGSFRDGIVSINTLNLQSGNSFGRITNAKLVANLNPNERRAQSGTIEVANFPVESLRPLPFFNNLPVDITGRLNGKATIGGNIYNPSAVGNLTLADATVNRQTLESVSGNFNYDNGRLRFASKVQVSGPEPVDVTGDIPAPTVLYTLAEIQQKKRFPSDDLKLVINVRNEGLAFINVLNQPVRWLNGKGSGSLIVTGTTRKPQLQGRVTLDTAAFQVAGLPGDITQVKGNLDFDFDRLRSDLTGQFSDGKLTAKGAIALNDPFLITEGKPDFDNPLTIFAERLKVDLKNRYTGNANGFLVVRGAVQAPVLSGEVALSEGRISLAGDTSNQNADSRTSNQANIAFNQLLVKLRNNTQVTRAPLLNFLAEGDIEVNGTLDNIQPSGRVNVLRGQINAISTRFRLDRAFDNYAVFIPSQGLNPNLNVRVIGAVPEVTRAPISNTPLDAFNQNRTSVSNLGAQRTLQVQATVTGSAQNPNIELRSTPQRTQAEILALIGGGLLQQSGGDPTAALANLAGGTVISFLQDAIGDALNLSEFNLSPTTTNPVGGRASTLGLSAEAAIDISKSFSVSVRGVINDPSQPTTYTLRYRVNPNTLVRTNTDFQGNNSTSVEFESRF